MKRVMDSSSKQDNMKYLKIVETSPSGKYVRFNEILGRDSVFENLKVIETDQTGRYVRYDKIIRKSALKTVYKGLDLVSLKFIFWTKTKLNDDILENKNYVNSLIAEANMLKSINYVQIVRYLDSWIDFDKKINNIISEYFKSGNLAEFTARHYKILDLMQSNDGISMKVIKKLARQILQGLDHLHCLHDLPIIHGDLKLENIYIIGNKCTVKIGDLNIVDWRGFNEDEDLDRERGYDHMVDIYSFGICLLRIVTRSEWSDSDEQTKKVESGGIPEALSNVTDLQLKNLIEKCLAPTASERPEAIELLNDPFFKL